MSVLTRITALFIGASLPLPHERLPHVTSTIIDRCIPAERQAKLIRDGRQALMGRRTHVDRAGHFEAPRIGA